MSELESETPQKAVQRRSKKELEPRADLPDVGMNAADD